MKQLTQEESIGIFLALAVVVATFYGFVGNPFSRADTITHDDQPIAIDATDNPEEAREALTRASDAEGNLTELIYEDVTQGSGVGVQKGDTVVVDYIGRLQDGTEFDNSIVRGEPFVFTVGMGEVIEGWEEGVVGMKVGGERVLLIPPAKAYGSRGVGVVPPNSTLLFSIVLHEIR